MCGQFVVGKDLRYQRGQLGHEVTSASQAKWFPLFILASSAKILVPDLKRYLCVLVFKRLLNYLEFKPAQLWSGCGRWGTMPFEHTGL